MKEKLAKIEQVLLLIGIAGIFVGVFVPVFSYISSGCIALTYLTSLLRQYMEKGRIKPANLILGIAAFCWIICQHFFPQGDWMIVGQIIIYGYLFVTQKELLGRIDKEFALIAAGSVMLRVGGMIYPFKWINYLNFLLQLCVIFKFLDPILEKIGQGHRKKRLEALEAKKRGETVDMPKNDLKEMFAFLKE